MPVMLMQGLLGDARRFKDYFSRPIEAGNDRHATERMRQVL
jgi:SNF2 family DNA or RNA helicase